MKNYLSFSSDNFNSSHLHGVRNSCMVVVASKHLIPDGADVAADQDYQGMVRELTKYEKSNHRIRAAKIIGRIKKYVGLDDKQNFLYEIVITQQWI